MIVSKLAFVVIVSPFSIQVEALCLPWHDDNEEINKMRKKEKSDLFMSRIVIGSLLLLCDHFQCQLLKYTILCLIRSMEQQDNR